MWTLADEVKRRRFLAIQSDHFAITTEGKPGSGVAQRFAQELASTKVESSSIRGLEFMAWSTNSVADILDYIRMRVGRDSRHEGWDQNSVGRRLAEHLESLRELASEFVKSHKITMDDASRELHLDLCREFLKHLVAHFEFSRRVSL